MVLHAAMVHWGVHLPLVYMCIVLYVKLIWCNGLACSYGQLGGSICLQYICTLSYESKLMWCNGFAEIYARSAMRCAKCGLAILQASMLDGGINLPWVYVHCAIYETYFGVMVLQRSMLNLIGGGQSAIGICALFYIYIYRSAMRCAKFGVVVFKAYMLNWRRRWGQSAKCICALFYIYIDLPLDVPSWV